MDNNTLLRFKADVASNGQTSRFKANPGPYHPPPLPTTHTFYTFLQRLHQLTLMAGSPLPVWDALPHSVEEHGVCFHTSRTNRQVEAWDSIRESLWARRSVSPPERLNTYFLLSTGNFLWQARPGGSAVTSELARGLLYLLAPLVERYSPAFAALLAYHRRNLVEAEGETDPSTFNVGQRDETDALVYTEHLRSLLSNDGFRGTVTEILRTALVPVRAPGLESKLGRCTAEKRHWRTRECEACKPFRWAARNTLIIRPTQLDKRELRNVCDKLFKQPEPMGYRDAFIRELQHAASCVHASEGVRWYSAEGHVLINFARLYENSLKQGRPSAYALFDSANQSDPWVAGFRFREYLAKRTGGSVITFKRPMPLHDAVHQSTWEWRDTLDLPYEFYRIDALSKFFKLERNPSYATEIQRARKASRQPSQPYTISRDYVDPAGASHPVFLRLASRKGWEYPKWHVALPYPVTALDLARNSQHVRKRFGRAYWSVVGVSKLSALPEQYPWAPHFYTWIDGVAGQLSLDFKLIRRNEKYKRVLVARQAGKTKHMGRFFETEDNKIRHFMQARTAGKLSEQEWGALELALPGRPRRSILKRIHDLADVFLYSDGKDYKVFKASGWFLTYSSKHYRRWLTARK